MENLTEMIAAAYAWAERVRLNQDQLGPQAIQRERIRVMLLGGARQCDVHRTTGAARETIRKVQGKLAKSMAAGA